jgi:thiamine biosynthesis lipoprotein
LDVSRKRIRLAERGMAITLNGIAQGFAADRALSAFDTHGVTCALVNAGEVGCRGRKVTGEQWTAGIQHPRQKDAYLALASLDGRCLATSGDYATTFTPDFVNNHIFDPATGRSPEIFSSVTILAPTAMDADALTKVVFIRGLEQGLKVMESVPHAEGLFVRKDGSAVETKGFPKAG